jgi:hypothetical protein
VAEFLTFLVIGGLRLAKLGRFYRSVRPLLENSGIVTSERVGRNRLWKIESGRLSEARIYLDQISAQWDATLERLRRFVEDNRPSSSGGAAQK